MATPLSADGCLLDLDGTVYVDDEVVPGAAEAIAALRSAGVPFRRITSRRGISTPTNP